MLGKSSQTGSTGSQTFSTPPSFLSDGLQKGSYYTSFNSQVYPSSSDASSHVGSTYSLALRLSSHFKTSYIKKECSYLLYLLSLTP